LVAKKLSLLMDAKQISHAIARIGHEILEAAEDDDQIVVIGIRSNGDHLADRLAEKLHKLGDRHIDVGYMDITLYRDDLMTNPEHPEIKTTDILFSLNHKLVILVDDVLFTGRTIRAALNQIPDYGRTKAVRLAVLIDRGGRELPIRADFVGKNVPTSPDDDIVVKLVEETGEDSVNIYARSTTKSAKATTDKNATRDTKEGGES